MNANKLCSLLALAALGCGAEPTPTGLPPDHPMVTPSPSPTPSPTMSPSPSPSPVQEGRATRRVSIAQLRRSIPALFAGVTWTNGARNNPQVMFDVLSRTLGEANYTQVTEENLEPNPIFAKFMDDMAGQVCSQAVTSDARPGAAAVVMLHPEDPMANLRYLRLKLHGIHVPEGSSEGLEELKSLYDGILADTQSVEQAWTGVCVAMLTAPELMAY